MAQNIYDDPEFFAKYAGLPRSVEGLGAAYEWPVFRALLPDVTGKSVLDLGCGTGALARRLRELGAVRVLGIDVSARMLAEAQTRTADPAILYRRSTIEAIGRDMGPFDLVVSSLALHYVADFASVCRAVARLLAPGGTVVFSVEHPMFTARAEQDWCVDGKTSRHYWPVENYADEGLRQTNWLGSPVHKYHRTVATYGNALIDAGFHIRRLEEPVPSQAFLDAKGAPAYERNRPLFLLISAAR